MEEYAQEVLRRFESMRTYRANFERTWSEIALRVLPRADDFIVKRAPGVKREEYVYDSTAQLALPAFSAAMESMLTPRTQKWHTLRPADPALLDNQEVAAYCEYVRDLLFRLRYAPYANFASQSYETYMSLGAFGTGALFIQDGLSQGIRYQCIPLNQVYVQEDAQGVVDTVCRRYDMTTRQAAQKFGADLPANISKFLEKEPDRNWEFIHFVHPNENRNKQYGNAKGMAIKACDVAIEGRKLIREGGYRRMPYAISRYTTAPREVYGRSPAWDALADVKTLNEMSKTSLRYGQQVADPAWVTADLDGLAPFAVRPGSINAGYMNEQGQVLAKSIAPEGDPRFTLEMANQRRESINRAFLITLFQILVDTPQMTATEAMLRAQEKGALLAPTMGRQQSEFLGPIITREIDILQAAGAIPPPPEALLGSNGLEIIYDSPLTRAQRSEEGVGILRTFEAAGQLAQFDPTITKVFNAERAMRRLAQINGAPIDILNSPEELEAQRAADAQQAQLAQLVQAGPALGQTAKSLAQANTEAQKAPF